MDNRQFNVNGSEKAMLENALNLVFAQEGNVLAKAYIIDPKKGMVLLWYALIDSTPLPAPFNAKDATEFVWTWLKSQQKELTIECVNWDADKDHDGHNELGWRVYCEEWGHIKLGPNNETKEASRYAICAVKPAYLWYGK